MLILLKKKAQGTAEYVIAAGIIIAAVIAMQTYVKRGFQGKIKDAVDYNSEEGAAMFKTSQYEPDYLNSSFNSTHSTEEAEELEKGGSVNRTLGSERSSRTGSQTITGIEE